MKRWQVVSFCAALALAAGAVPARAGDFAQRAWSYWDIRDAIYARINLIAHLEADPEIDDALKGPAITAARAEIHQLRAMIGPPPWKWPTPCCYSRKPLYIR